MFPVHLIACRKSQDLFTKVEVVILCTVYEFGFRWYFDIKTNIFTIRRWSNFAYYRFCLVNLKLRLIPNDRTKVHPFIHNSHTKKLLSIFTLWTEWFFLNVALNALHAKCQFITISKLILWHSDRDQKIISKNFFWDWIFLFKVNDSYKSDTMFDKILVFSLVISSIQSVSYHLFSIILVHGQWRYSSFLLVLSIVEGSHVIIKMLIIYFSDSSPYWNLIVGSILIYTMQSIKMLLICLRPGVMCR